MRKIITGLLGLVLVGSVVVGTAYALFSDTATVQGVNISTAEAGLEVGLDDGSGGFDSVQTLPPSAFGLLLPGDDDWGRFSLRNTSSSSAVDPLNLNISARLTQASGDWNALKDVVEAVVYVEDDPSETTGWRYLSTWNQADGVTIPGGSLAPDSERTYIVRYRIRSDVGNEAAGKSLTNVTFVFTGTQVTP